MMDEPHAPGLPAGVSVAPIAEVDPESAAALLGASMAEGFGRTKSAALWRWKHHQNPAGASLGLAAYDEAGRVIALRPFMRWRLVDAGGRPVTAVRAVDTAVAAQWRGRGIFSALTRLAVEQLEDNRIELVFNTPNEQSAPGYRKMGWRLLGHPTVWVAPRIGRRQSGASAGGVAEPPRALPEEWPPVVELLDDLSGAAAGNSTAPAALRVLKDRAFLEWRYADHPNLQYGVVDRAPGESRHAFAVVRADQRGRRSGIALCDVFADRWTRGAWRGLVAAIRSACDADYVVTAEPPGRIAAVTGGFLPVRWRNVQLAVRAPVESERARWATSRRGWSLSLGDLESF